MEKIGKEIKILGAGISGLTAAINLAKAGYNVKVYDKARDSGARFEGDLQGIENWSKNIDALDELKLMNIKINFHLKPHSHTFFIEGKDLIENEYKKPLFYLVKRGMNRDSFDQGLKKHALNSGVNIFYNSSIKEEDVDIVATGPFKSKVLGYVKGIKFKTDFEDIAVGLSNKETSQKAYAYLLVDNNFGVICSCAELKSKDFDKMLKKAIQFFKEKYNIKLKDIKPIGGYSAFHFKRKYEQDARIYVGEAAGLQDYLFGFGMRYAMQSGFLAADSIINNYDYEKAAKKKFENKIKTSIVNRFLWDEFEKTNYIIPKLLFKLFKNRTNFFYRLYQGNILDTVLYPIVCYYIKKKYKIEE